MRIVQAKSNMVTEEQTRTEEIERTVRHHKKKSGSKHQSSQSRQYPVQTVMSREPFLLRIYHLPQPSTTSPPATAALAVVRTSPGGVRVTRSA